MRIKILITVFCIFAIGSNVVLAQESGEVLSISLQDAISMAIESSEDLKIQGNQIKRRSSLKKEERAEVLPQISVAAQWANNFEYPAAAAVAGTRDYTLDAGVSVTQSLFTFGQISNTITAAQKALEASSFDYEGEKQKVIYDTKISFYSACLSIKTLEIAEKSLDNALENKKILKDRSSGGRASKYDNIKILSDVAARNPSVNNARADFVSSIEALKVAVGIESQRSLKLLSAMEESFPDFQRQELALTLYHNQPAIKSLSKSVEEKESLVRSKKAAFMPEISIFATWNHKGSSNDSYIGSDNLNDYGVAGLKVSIPIWLGGKNYEALSQARIDKNDAELQYQKGKEDYLLLLDQSLGEYNEYKKTLEANNKSISLAKEAFDYSQKLFGSGQISVSDLNDAELQLTSAKLNKELTLFNLNRILAIIERLTLLEESNE